MSRGLFLAGLGIFQITISTTALSGEKGFIGEDPFYS